MKDALKLSIQSFLARASIQLTGLWPSHLHFSVMRRLNEIQLSSAQLNIISTALREKAPCRLLVFGIGNDSAYWSLINRGGITIFLEDNEDWLDKISRRSKRVKSFLIDYDTIITDWKMLLESPPLLETALPDELGKEGWDIILVDAPEGWHDQTPGRMKSIYFASKLINDHGDVFVHDCNREIEDIYCTTFLKKENLKREENGPCGLLRHYHINSRSHSLTYGAP